MTGDWTVAAAKSYAAICRKHGLRCRVVRCRNTDSYLAIYRDAADPLFAEKHVAAKAEALAAGWDGFEMVCKTE